MTQYDVILQQEREPRCSQDGPHFETTSAPTKTILLLCYGQLIESHVRVMSCDVDSKLVYKSGRQHPLTSLIPRSILGMRLHGLGGTYCYSCYGWTVLVQCPMMIADSTCSSLFTALCKTCSVSM